jgi:single-stranded DNA-specific DHH superfamily exonuclease
MDLDTPENHTLEELTAGRKFAPPGLRAAAEELGLKSLAKSNQAKIATLLNLPKRTPLAQAAWAEHILSAKTEAEAKPYIKQLLQVKQRCQSVQRDYLGQAWSEHDQNLGTPMALAKIDQDDSHLFAGYAGLIALQYARSSGSPSAVFIPQDKERTRYKWSLRTGAAEVGEQGALTLAERLRDLKAPEGASPAGGHAKAMGGICSAEQIEKVQQAMRQWAQELGLPAVREANPVAAESD